MARKENWNVIAAHLIAYFEAGNVIDDYVARASTLPEMTAKEKSTFQAILDAGYGFSEMLATMAYDLKRKYGD